MNTLCLNLFTSRASCTIHSPTTVLFEGSHTDARAKACSRVSLCHEGPQILTHCSTGNKHIILGLPHYRFRCWEESSGCCTLPTGLYCAMLDGFPFGGQGSTNLCLASLAIAAKSIIMWEWGFNLSFTLLFAFLFLNGELVLNFYIVGPSYLRVLHHDLNTLRLKIVGTQGLGRRLSG